MFAVVLLLATSFRSAYASPGSHAVTAYGNAQIDTAQSKFGGAAGLFDGAGDYLSTPDSVDWAFGSGDFTIDFRVRFKAFPAAGQSIVFCSQTTDLNNLWRFAICCQDATSYAMVFWSYVAGANEVWILKTLTAGVAPNTWYHHAIVRNGNNWYVFFDGVQQGTTGSSSASLTDFAQPLTIGSQTALNWGGVAFNGWLDEFRISKGVARWTSNFSPPTSAHVADLSTVLLLHMDGADGSTTFTDDAYTGPTSFSFNVKASATQIVVTLTYSWSGSGSPPSGSITIAGPGGTPTLEESGAVVYDRTSIAVSGSTSTYSIIHRATFTITPPGSAQTWTATVSLPGISSYNVAIEVS